MTLSQVEINALISAAGGREDERAADAARAAAARPVKTYDFRRPDKFSKDQLRTLHSIHESFGRLAAAALSDKKLRFTARPMTMTLGDTSQMIWSEYQSGLTLPTYMIELDAPQLDQHFLIDFDLPLLKGWIDRLLGGSGAILPERTEPTPIEKALILKLVDTVVEPFTEAWSNVAEVTPAIVKEHQNTTSIRIAAPSDVVAVLSFECRYEIGRTKEGSSITQSAPITICIPHAALEPILPRLSATSWYSQQPKLNDGSDRVELSSSLQDVEVPLSAILGGVELTVDELAGLKPGDIIRFGERADHPVRLSVMDQAMAWAVPGKVGDHVALRLLTPLQQLMEA